MKVTKLIVLCGAQNTGKSYMLKSMAELDFKNITMIQPKDRSKIRTDYTAVLECGERQIGIRSQGDTKDLIDEGHKLLKEYSNKYDCVVCTCHPSMITYIIEKYNADYAHVVPKLEPNNKDNDKCREIILKLINSI